jgi:hypothetical protein
MRTKIEENVDGKDTVSFVEVPGNMDDRSHQGIDIIRHQTESEAVADINLEGGNM